MAHEKKNQRTTVMIHNQQYTVVGQEPPEHVKEVARYVDEKMKELKKTNPYLDSSRLAVLTAVNVVDEYMKIKSELENLLQQKERNRTTGDN